VHLRWWRKLIAIGHFERQNVNLSRFSVQGTEAIPRGADHKIPVIERSLRD
jgi:hypothetical protein